MIFYLIHGRHNLNIRQKLFQIFLAVVGNTDRLDLSGLQQLLHRLVRLNMGPGLVQISSSVRQLGK